MAFTIERAIKWWFRDKPDYPAIWYDGETLTFGELRDWSARLAAALKADGVQTGDRVAVVAQNSLEYAVLLVATMLTGAIANPITFRSSARELTRSLSITEPKLVFSDAAGRGGGHAPSRARPCRQPAHRACRSPAAIRGGRR